MACDGVNDDDDTCRMQAVQNLGLAVVPLAAGAIIDARGFLIVEFFFILCLCRKLLFSRSLKIVDFYWVLSFLNLMLVIFTLK